MTAAAIVGFTPAHGSQAPGTGVGGHKPAGDSPLGLFDALLALAGTTAIEGSQILPAPSPDQQGAFAALLAALPDASPAADTIAPPVAPGEKQASDTPDLATLVRGLLDALSAAAPATGNGKPMTIPVEHKLEAAIHALGRVLGITLPATGNRAPAPVEPGAPTAVPATILNPLAAIATNPTTAPAAPAVAAAAPAQTVPVATDTSVVVAMAPTDGAAPALVDGDGGAEAAAPRTVQAAVPVPPAAVKLAERIAILAESIKPLSPALAEKLAALADRIGVGEIDAEAMAKLGLPTEMDAPDTEVDAAIARLLPSAPETKPAASPAPFTAATLALPNLGATTSRGNSTVASKPDAARATLHQPVADRAATEDEGQFSRVDQPTSRDAGQRPPAGNAAPQAASIETPASQAQSSTPGTPTAHGLASTTIVSADTKTVFAAYKAPAQQINIPQVAFEIVRQVQAGNSRFQIRIDPPELGRIDVKLDVDSAGNVQARLTVERAETLDLMQRDSRALERALAQAGLDSSKTSLEFSLRQNPFAHDERAFGGDGKGGRHFADIFGGGTESDAPTIPAVAAYRALSAPGGINIFV